MSERLRVALSKPVTARFPVAGAHDYAEIANEAEASFVWGNKYGQPWGERFAQATTVWKLFRHRRRADAVVMGRYGEMLMLLQALWPFGRKPALLLDTEWFLRPRRPLHQRIGKLYRRLIARGATRIQVFCEAEADAYAEFYGIPRDKFVFIPYCPADETSQERIPESNYIFTGGLHDRDFKTLFEAVRDLPVEVRIAAPPQQIPPHLVSPNMKILGRIPRDEYFRQLGGAKVVFLSLDPIVRCPGVITYVYAMKIGKAVVVNEPRGAPSYITDGEDGLIVPARDPAALRAGIERVLNDDALRQRLGERARAVAAERFSPAAYWRYVDASVRDLSRP